MKQIHLAVFLLFATFACHLCQSATDKPTTASTTVSNVTTTLAPKTTSTTTTTTTTTTTSTTPASTTTSKPTPPPTPTPKPTPPATTISGNVTEFVDKKNFTCLRYEFAVQFHIKYPDSKNTTKTAVVPLPLNSKQDSTPNGTCTSAKESFSLSHGSLKFNLTFAKNENSVYLDSINLHITYDNETFPDIRQDLDNKAHIFNLTNFSPNFNVEKSHSYFCANVTVPKNDEGDLQVVFSSLKLQAFMSQTQNGEYSSEHNCQNEINDVVPIAVGAALTGLVVIVMIAYFIGRRRSRRLAYQSV